jgi:ATP-dependent Clp protease ATP-binding subunit ClpC
MSLPRSSELERVLSQAEDIAEQTAQDRCSSHVLLALFTVSNQAAVFLNDRHITLEQLLAELEGLEGEPDDMLGRILRRAQRIARGSQADALNSLHVLAALVREADSQAHRLMKAADVDVSAVRATVMSYATGALPLPGRPSPDETGSDSGGRAARSNSQPSSEGSDLSHSSVAHLSSEEAPSPIAFHPSLGVDPDTREEESGSGESGGDAAASRSGSRSGPERRQPTSRSQTTGRFNTQVETQRPDDQEEDEREGSEEETSDDASAGSSGRRGRLRGPATGDGSSDSDTPAIQEPDDEPAEAEPSADEEPETDDDPNPDYRESAKDAAQSLGSRLFDRSDEESDDEPVDPPDQGESEVEAEPSEERPESPEPSRDGAQSRESDDPDLAGGRATTIPPGERRSEGRNTLWDSSIAEFYELRDEEFPNLVEFGRNLTLEAALGRIDKVIGRERETMKLIDIVGKRRANNPILIGEPGVGKTAIVEGLARRFVEMATDGNELGHRVVVELELGRILSGTHLRGALSERLMGIKEEVEDAEGDVIVFLDEIHAWLDAGGSDGSDAAGELKTAMARGRFPCIGATTNEEFRQFVESDPAFERRFQVVLVEEPSIDTSIEITEGIRPYYEDHHGVSYRENALEAAVRMSRRYIHDRRLPDKAISVLDLAGSRAARVGDGTIGRREIAEVVAESAGLPVDRLTQDDRERFLNIEGELRQKIVGQRHVIETVSEVLRRNYAGFRGHRPIGSLLFLGPTGVGKTETVKALADFLFHDRDAVVQIDMSEYMKSHAVSRFVGAPPGYVGHDQGGQLTEAIRRRPYQIVLLDEIEKAHPDVLNVLLQLFEEGQLTDGKGRTVDFSNALIVMTSNLGADIFPEQMIEESSPRIGFGQREASSGGSDNRQEIADKVLDQAKGHFSPELWNRIDEKLVFDSLSRQEVSEIAELQLGDSADRIAEESGIELTFDQNVVDYLIDNGGYDPELGARPMRQAIQRLVEGTVARHILRGEAERGDTIRVVRKDDDLTCKVDA